MSPDAQCFFEEKEIVVLGCGYVGGAVARAVAARGAHVHALTRNAGQAARLRDAGIAVVEADLAGADWHRRMPSRVDGVLNCVSSGGGGVDGYRHSYVDGMRSVARWAQGGKIGTFIYTGSTSVYPQGDGAVVDESASTGGDSERAALLVEAERLVPAGAWSRWFILRLAGIYGPGRHHLLDQLRAGETLSGDGAHRLNLVHRDDIVAAVLAAWAAPASVRNEIVNLADDAPATKREVAAWLAARLGLPAPRFDPSAPSRRRAVTPDRVIANAKAARVLGWRPAHADFRAGYENLPGAL